MNQNYTLVEKFIAGQGLWQRWQDAILNRRHDWTGAVMYVDQAAADRYNNEPGYYRVTGHNYEQRWMYWDGIGNEMPNGQPVYINGPDNHDYKAIPSTVFPWKTFWLFGVLGTILWTLFVGVVQYDGFGDGGVYWSLGLVGTLGTVARKWFFEIEPVRATKVGIVLLAIHIIWRGKLDRERAEYWAYTQQQDQRRAQANPFGGNPLDYR